MRTGTAARHAALGAVAWLLAATGTFAQTPVSDFGQISTRVRVGETVYVTDSAGREHRGMLFDLSASQLVLESGGKRQDFPAGQVAAISWRAPDPLRNGALIGMGIGAGSVGILALTDCSGCGPYVLGAMAVYGGIGAAIGTGIDAITPGKKVRVYKGAGDKPAAALSLAPILSARRKGLAATVRF
jgi:hypothetical protein